MDDSGINLLKNSSNKSSKVKEIKFPLEIQTNTNLTKYDSEQSNLNYRPHTKSVEIRSALSLSPTKKGNRFSLNLPDRLDSNGTPILKGSKKHKVSFKANMVVVHKVENWKKLNVDTNVVNNSGSSCCQIY